MPLALSAIGACSLEEPQPKFFPVTMMLAFLLWNENQDPFLPSHVPLAQNAHVISDMVRVKSRLYQYYPVHI